MQRDPEKKEGQLIRSCLPANSGVILEIGCGDGRLTGELSQISYLTVAMDIFEDQLKLAQSSMVSHVQAVAARGEMLPISANHIDAVVFTLSLHHHQDPCKALSEAVRVLKEDGKILVLEPEASTLLSKLFAIHHDENSEYELAETAIDQSGLREIRSGSIKTQWIFEDYEELVNYIFDFFGTNRDKRIEDQMSQLLRGSRKMMPLPIQDIIRFWLLSSDATLG